MRHFLVYGINRWTNASRPAARHINNGDGKPLCGSERACYWEKEEGEPTCKKCTKLSYDPRLHLLYPEEKGKDD